MVAELRGSRITPPIVPVNTDNWLTRTEAADLLGVSDQTIANWDRQQILHSQVAKRRLGSGHVTDVYVYDPRELANAPVKRVVGRTPGDIAARAFEMFERSESRRQVVIATREEPEKVEELYDQWLNMGGTDVILTVDARQQLMDLLETKIESVADLLVAVKAFKKPGSDPK